MKNLQTSFNGKELLSSSGLNRISKIENFSRNPLAQRMLGLSKAMNADTISNSINRLEAIPNNELIPLIGNLSSQVETKVSTCIAI